MFKGYNIDYYTNLLRIHSHTAEKINSIRWNWIRDCKAKTILDYGCGVGWFKAFSFNGAQVDTFDIMSVPQTGITLKRYDLITFWDVIEHIKNLDSLKEVISMTDCVAMTVPVLPDYTSLVGWRHYKPIEHVHIFKDGDVEKLMSVKFGLDLVKKDQPECPPRLDIWNFIFTRRQQDGKKTTIG